MNRIQILATFAGMTALIVLLDLRFSAEISLPVLFTFPLILCAIHRSKWLLWSTAGMATAVSAASMIWVFHRVAPANPWIAWTNRGLVVANLLTFTALIHFWLKESHKVALAAAELERHCSSLLEHNEQLTSELAKIKAFNRGKGKPLVLTVKQYQALAGQLSDLHRTMVITAMCSGMHVSEVLALRWSQVDFVSGLLSREPGADIGRIAEVRGDAPREQVPLDPLLVEALLEWRSSASGSGLVFPSHVTGRCYHAGHIQQDYIKPAARKLGLTGVNWHTFPNSYRSWINDEGTATGVQQKLMRHAKVSTLSSNHSTAAPLKAKRKVPHKPVQRVVPNGGLGVEVSAEGS
jgi:integrase